MRRFAALAVGCVLIIPGAAQAAPYTVDRLLALEQLGPARIDPSQRWLVVQTYAPWNKAPTYDLDLVMNLGLGRIRVFDLKAGAAERKLDLPNGAGYTALVVSPQGRQLAVGRLIGHAFELGVVDLETGQARWLGVTPRQQTWGPSVLWRNEEELLVSARPADAPDITFGYGYLGQERLAEKTAASARGALGSTVMGSGQFRGLSPTAPAIGLVSIDLRSNARRILVPGQVRDMSLSPDGRAVAAVVQGETIQYDLPEPTTSASSSNRNHLILADLDSGRAVEPCQACDPMDRFLAWAPNGREVLVYARQGEMGYRDGGRFWRLSVDGAARALDLGALKPVFGETYDTAGVPLGGWLGGAPVVYAQPAGGRADYWRIEPARVVNLTAALPAGGRAIGADDGAWAVAAAGEIWRVTAREARPWGVSQTAITSLATPPAGFRGSQNYVPPLADLGLARTASPTLPWPGQRLPPAPAEGRIVGQTSLGAIDAVKDRRGVERILLAPSASAEQTLVTVNADLAKVESSVPIAIRHKGLDGKDLTSWLYLPPNSAPGARLPVVVIPYPGFSYDTPPRVQQPGVLCPSVNAQVLAAQGYAVILPSMPYLDRREPMAGLADQILSPVDTAAGQGLVDPNRVAIWGHSYGGYAAIAAATQSARFKAVITTAAGFDLAALYGRMGPAQYLAPETGVTIFATTGWQETGQARLRAPPWKDRDLYTRNSPITYVDRIKAPIAIFHGDADKGMDQAYTLFGALYRQNKDAIFVTYHGEGHSFYAPGNVRDYFARVVDLLDRTIGPHQGVPTQ
ncbi:hypothetical protein CFHF_19635 [Caulobacter flavus]|uniref:Peptidase S9 prolyl oligopeptidase catalytic domain-containing protein n=1 Tax=Caulobacter flavus TaxID=1679497 RepID=A0A2N5CNZ3_9CAUL|nr:prolyl oligopeptidase family serine peptidase [Caulobacter flavus]AYV48613.1 hypothetical protein C1707_21430 [Caulobacter flavus]PLR08671.1 hypothetical protein CFHF_19635 [Caulobacter flavus]